MLAPAALATALAVSGCAKPESELRIDAADIVIAAPSALEVDLEFLPSPALAAALDRGVPLTLVFTLDDGVHREARRLTVRYLPLANQYQWRDEERAESRLFARRAQLVSALDRVRLPLAHDWADGGRDALTLAVTLDGAQLPAALRLPALIDPAWRVAPATHRWPAAR